jgi:hypothetical protein
MVEHWGILNRITEIRWGDDASCDPKGIALDFIKKLEPMYNLSLQRLELKGVFDK